MEHLAGDFADFVVELTDVTAEDRRRIAGFARVNALEYDHEVEQLVQRRAGGTAVREQPGLGRGRAAGLRRSVGARLTAGAAGRGCSIAN